MKVFTNKNVKQTLDVESGGDDKSITILISASPDSKCLRRLKIILCVQLIILIGFLTFAGFFSFGGSSPSSFSSSEADARVGDITQDPITPTTGAGKDDREKIENILQPDLQEINSGIDDLNEALEDFHRQVVGTLDEPKSGTFLNTLTDQNDPKQQLSQKESDWLLPALVNTESESENDPPIRIFLTGSVFEGLGDFPKLGEVERNDEPWLSLSTFWSEQSDENSGLDRSSEGKVNDSDDDKKSVETTEKSQGSDEEPEEIDEKTEKIGSAEWFKGSPTGEVEATPEIPADSSWWENSQPRSDYGVDSDYYSYEDDDGDSLMTILSSLLDDLDDKMVPMTNDQLSSDLPEDKEAETLKGSDEKSCDPETEVFVALSLAFPEWNNKCVDREVYEKAALDEILKDSERSRR